jgi:hypothetical protein
MARTGQSAINYALSQVGMWKTVRTCQIFTRGVTNTVPSGATAYLAWRNAKKKHSCSADKAPKGVPVYWRKKDNPGAAGHAAFTYATGRVVTTDWGGISGTKGKVAKARIADISSRWGMEFLGWVEIDGHGIKVGTPVAAPSKPAKPKVGNYKVIKTPGKNSTVLPRTGPGSNYDAKYDKRRKKGQKLIIRKLVWDDNTKAWWGQAAKLWYKMTNLGPR